MVNEISKSTSTWLPMAEIFERQDKSAYLNQRDNNGKRCFLEYGDPLEIDKAEQLVSRKLKVVQDALASGRAYNSMAVGELMDELAYHAHAHDMLLEEHSALKRKYNAAKKQLADRKSTYEALQVDCSSLRQRLATTDDELQQQRSKYQTFRVKYGKAGQNFFAFQKLCDNKVRQLEEKVDEERRGAARAVRDSEGAKRKRDEVKRQTDRPHHLLSSEAKAADDNCKKAIDRARSAERTALAIILETFQKREGTRRKVLVT